MILNQQHRDKDNPPNIPTTMGKPERKSKEDLSESLADCAVARVKALQAPAVPAMHTYLQSSSSVQRYPDGISTSKRVNLRSQYLAQLRTLQNLHVCDDGVLTQEEFLEEKATTLKALK